MAKEILNSAAIKLNDIKKYIAANVNLQIQQKAAPRLYMVGAPGCGKSDIMRQICEEKGWALAVRYVSNMAIEQLTGLPVKPEANSVTTWSRPELFNFSNLEYAPENYQEGKTPTVLLLDDFHLADRLMQKYMFQLLTYMGLNGYKLPANTAIILAGNRNNDKAGAMPIPAPVCNRMMFVEVTSEAEDWLKNFALKNNVRGDICTFINNKGDVYLSGEPIETHAWASPRSWTYLGYQMDAYEEIHGNIDLDELRIMATGLLGEEVTQQFIMYRELFAKWDFEQLKRQNWETVKKRYADEASKNPTAVYAIINSAVTWAINTYKKHDFDPKDKNVTEAIKLTYNTLAYLLVMKCKNNVNIQPLVAAGTKYIHMFQEAVTANKTGKPVKPLIEFILDEMTQQRDVDWIFYNLLSGIFNMTLDEDDHKAIAAAEARIAQGKIDI